MRPDQRRTGQSRLGHRRKTGGPKLDWTKVGRGLPSHDWLSHGPLLRFDSLCGWGSAHPTPPASDTQSSLFLHIDLLWASPLPNHSTEYLLSGDHEQGPVLSSLLAHPTLKAHSTHNLTRNRHQSAAVILQSWEKGGAHLPHPWSCTSSWHPFHADRCQSTISEEKIQLQILK